MSQEFLMRQAANFLRNQKRDEELETWMREIREEAFVEIRNNNVYLKRKQTPMTTRLAITPGEPAGIDPDITLQLNPNGISSTLIVIADLAVLEARAELLGLPRDFNVVEIPGRAVHGRLNVLPLSAATPVTAGQMDAKNSPYVINCLSKRCNSAKPKIVAVSSRGQSTRLPSTKQVSSLAVIPSGLPKNLSRESRDDAGDHEASRCAGHHPFTPARGTRRDYEI